VFRDVHKNLAFEVVGTPHYILGRITQSGQVSKVSDRMWAIRVLHKKTIHAGLLTGLFFSSSRNKKKQ